MRRSLAVTLALALGLLAAPPPPDAQQSGEVPRIGLLDTASHSPDRERLWDVFRRRLRDFGYAEGANVAFDGRWANGQVDRLPSLAAELVRLKVNVIVAASTQAALAAKQATTAIPIVFTNVADAVGAGLVASLSRPGGNATGLTTLSTEMTGKRLELLREIVPRASRVAVLWDQSYVSSAIALQDTQAAARSLGVRLQVLGVRGPAEFDDAFAAMVRERANALIVMPGPVSFTERRRLVDLAAKRRLPAAYVQREYAEAGGLMAYGPHYVELFRNAATYVDKILKGAKPADLPVEQPTKFEMVVNLKTAKTLGLTIPRSVLSLADEVIQ